MPSLYLPEKSVHALKGAGATTYYWDTHTPAFGIRVGKRSKARTVIRGKNRERLPRHCHLELHVPSKRPLPMTDTGYRSHFLPPGQVEAAGGPAAYVTRWLQEAARDPVWRKRQNADRQLDLFDRLT